MEFKPLFDYSGEQDASSMYMPESDEEEEEGEEEVEYMTAPTGKMAHVHTKKQTVSRKVIHAEINTVNDDSWLPPPPKHAKARQADPTHIQLRMKQAELQSFTAKASKTLQDVKVDPTPNIKLPDDKEKVVIKIQDKSGNCQQFRLGMDDKFEKLFNAYAASNKVSPSELNFRFDGNAVLGAATPRELELENEDIIEVYMKSLPS